MIGLLRFFCVELRRLTNSYTKTGAVDQLKEQTETTILLAAGYAVLLRRDGYTQEEIKLLIKVTYQLSFADAEKAWQLSLKQHAAVHKKISRETVLRISGQFVILAVVIILNGLIWIEISNYVAVIIFLIVGFILFGLVAFIQQYLSISLSASLKSDISDNNKLASFAPVLFALVLLFAGMYVFHYTELQEENGIWIKNVVIEKYGEKGSTKGKSPSWFTIMRIKNHEDTFRYFDSEKQYSLVPIDSFLLKPEASIDIFVTDRSLFSIHGYNDVIINVRQNNRQLTSLEHRNRLVNEANKIRLLYTSIFTILYMIVCVIYGRYLNDKKVLSTPLIHL